MQPSGQRVTGSVTSGCRFCFLWVMCFCWFLDKYEEDGMIISTTKSEAMVLSQKMVKCPLNPELLPQLKEFKYFRVLFRSEE